MDFVVLTFLVVMNQRGIYKGNAVSILAGSRQAAEDDAFGCRWRRADPVGNHCRGLHRGQIIILVETREV